jgi:4-carboxymuconolactone decarboxylase
MRLDQLLPDQLDADQRELYDYVRPRAQAAQEASPDGPQMVDDRGRLQGPLDALLHHPAIGRTQHELLGRLRSQSALSPRVGEILVLAVAASQRSAYEWAAHSALARRLGITDDQLAGFAAGARVRFDDAKEDVAMELALALVSTGDVDDELYARAYEALGDAGIVDAVTLVGFYQLLALEMRVFRVQAPPPPWAADS